MATYLQLCQKVARDSGTISGTSPATVSGQTGRLGLIVAQVAEAWVQIQNLHAHWRWMRGEFSGTTTSGAGQYTNNSWALTDWAEWVHDEYDHRPHSIYLTATGVSDERVLIEIPWRRWREQFDRGTQTNSYPAYYAISPANEFCLGPTPDATYTVKGEYRKTVETLSANADEPNCPARFHDIIAWRALMLLAQFDEASSDYFILARQNYLSYLDALRRDQLPATTTGPALA